MAFDQCPWSVGIKAAVGGSDKKRKKKKKEKAPPHSLHSLPSRGLLIGMNFMADTTIGTFEPFVHDENNLCNAYHSAIWLAN